MGSIERRIEALEARFSEATQGVADNPRRARLFERYFRAHENARRELQGLEPLPDLPYTQEDYENDLDTLETTIPAYRNSLGWKTEEARVFLNWWERHIRERLYGKDQA